MSFTSVAEGTEPSYSLGNSKFVPSDFQFQFSGAIERENLATVRNMIYKYPNLIHAVWKSVSTRGVYKQGRFEYEYYPIIYWLIAENKTHRYEIMQYLLSTFSDLKITANICEKTNILHRLAAVDDFNLFRLVFKDSRVQSSRMINEQGYRGSTPLMCALESSCKTEAKMEIVKLILTHPLLDINIIGTCKNDKYEITSMYGAIHCIRTLEEAELIFTHPNVNVNAVTLDGSTVVHPRSLHVPEVLSFLLNDPRVHANILNKKGYSPLHAYAALCGSYRSGNVTRDNQYFQSMQLLLEHPSIDVNLATGDAEGESSLHISIKHKHNELVKLMIQNDRVDVNQKNKRGMTAVQLAFGYSPDFSLDYLKMLLTNTTRIDWTTENVTAVFGGYASNSIYKCLRKGTVSDKIDYKDYANLFEDWLIYLMDRKEQEEAQQQETQQAQEEETQQEQEEAQQAQEEALSSVKRHSVDFHHRITSTSSSTSYSPLYNYAVTAGMIPVVQLLWNRRCFQVNEVCDYQGNTALHLATEHEDIEFVNYLLSSLSSIDFTLRNKAGKTVLEVIQNRLSSSYSSDAHRFEAGKDSRKEIQKLLEEAIKLSRLNKLLAMVRPRVVVPATTTLTTTTNQSSSDDDKNSLRNDSTIEKTKKNNENIKEQEQEQTSQKKNDEIRKNERSENTHEEDSQQQKKKEESKALSLLALTVAQCVDLMHKLFPAVNLKDIVVEEGINGVLLNEISSMEDIRDLRLDSRLKTIQARALLGALERLRKEGVIL